MIDLLQSPVVRLTVYRAMTLMSFLMRIGRRRHGRTRYCHGLPAAGLALFLSGCASVPQCEPVTVKVPVIMPCVQSVPKEPPSMMETLPDTATDFEKIQALTIDFIAQKQYVNELKAVLEGCR